MNNPKDSNSPHGPFLYDVSIVLNVHREAMYIRSTLLSLNACAKSARCEGTTIQLVTVFDRADQATIEAFESVELDGFNSVVSVHVVFGSLGLSRNAGIEMADGEFIWTADGDDLVSSNAIARLLSRARKVDGEKWAFFVEYYIGFGEKYFVARYENSILITAADFAFSHSFVSRVFIKRKVYSELLYRDLKLSDGFAFEDWDFNARLFADGYSLEVVPECAVFYRQRRDSLLQLANVTSARLIPHSELFEPELFLKLMSQKREEFKNWDQFLNIRRRLHDIDLVKEFFGSPVMREALAEASEIDPEIDAARLEKSFSYCPVPWKQNHWGFELENVFELVGTQKFSDILLLPWLSPGGAEKYILQVLAGLYSQNSSLRMLIITGQAADSHGWRDQLPDYFTFIDMYNAFPLLNDEERGDLIARTILSVAGQAVRIHLKPCEFSHNFIDRFGAAISSSGAEITYYRFSDSGYSWNKHNLRDPWAIRFLRRNHQYLDRVVSDCSSIRQRDIELIPAISSKFYCLYSLCKSVDVFPMASSSPQFRLLWASRISSEKRPDLVAQLAKALARHVPQASIDVYGTLGANYGGTDLFDGANISYLGGFDGFYTLPTHRYDALLYTTEYDGLPNVILEAVTSGLSVIAPDIGGIPEVVRSDTGFLVHHSSDNAILLANYVECILSMYRNWNDTLQKRQKAAELVGTRHGYERFCHDLKRIFQTID